MAFSTSDIAKVYAKAAEEVWAAKESNQRIQLEYEARANAKLALEQARQRWPQFQSLEPRIKEIMEGLPAHAATGSQLEDLQIVHRYALEEFYHGDDPSRIVTPYITFKNVNYPVKRRFDGSVFVGELMNVAPKCEWVSAPPEVEEWPPL
jgi:hypothetical protein